MGRYHYVFPKWTNAILPAALVVGAIAPLYVALVVAYGFSPRTTDVGYQPIQPVPYDHDLHAGQLGIDCRYCHNTVEHAAKAAIPPTQTCMNCHVGIHRESNKLADVRRSYETGDPIEWVRVHDLPDYSYFDHSAHVTRGVGCVECHGRVDRMEIVWQEEELSMGWCLECHRDPERYLRDPALVTNLGWAQPGRDFEALVSEVDTPAMREHLSRTHGADDVRAFLEARLGRSAEAGELLEHDRVRFRELVGGFWREHNNLNPNQDCSTCHR